MVYYSKGTRGGAERYGPAHFASASGAIAEGNHGSAAAIFCREANTRPARSFGEWDLPAQLFRKGVVLIVSFRKNGERFGIRPRSANRCSPPSSLRDQTACDQRRQRQVGGGYDHRPWTTQAWPRT